MARLPMSPATKTGRSFTSGYRLLGEKVSATPNTIAAASAGVLEQPITTEDTELEQSRRVLKPCASRDTAAAPGFHIASDFSFLPFLRVLRVLRVLRGSRILWLNTTTT